MKKTIIKKQFKYEKSSFLIDLVQHQKGSLYVEITQKILNQEELSNTIRLNPSVIDDLMGVLEIYRNKILASDIKKRRHLSKVVQKKIQDRYFIGVSMKDIAMQLGLSEELVEMTLRERGIQIVPFKIPRFWKRRKKR